MRERGGVPFLLEFNDLFDTLFAKYMFTHGDPRLMQQLKTDSTLFLRIHT